MGKMTEGEKAGIWLVVYLCMVLFAAWFTVVCLAVWHIKEWL